MGPKSPRIQGCKGFHVGVSGDDCDGCPGKNPTGVMSDEALDH